MKKILLKISVFVITFMMTIPLTGKVLHVETATKTYYVSKKGSDTGKGTKNDPFKTIQKAINIAKAGSTIYVKDGTYREAITFKRTGTKDNYITLKALNSHKAKITLKKGASGPIIDLNGKSFIRIEDFDIGNVTAKEVYGIFIGQGVKNVIIKNNKIHDIKTNMPNNADYGANGILCFGEGKTEEKAIQDIEITENEVYNNVTGWSEAISIAGNAKNIKVTKNTVHDNTNIGIDFYGNASYCKTAELDQPRFCEASDNIVYNCKCSYADNAGIYVDGARDTVIKNNKVYSNFYGIEVGSEEGYGKDNSTPVKGIKVYGNTIYNNSSGGIRIGGFATNVSGTVMNSEIYNNTLKNNGAAEDGYNGEINIEKTKNIKIYNNKIWKSESSQEAYPMINIGSDVSASYIQKLQMYGNTYYTTLKPNKVLFYLFNRECIGLDTKKGMKAMIKTKLGVDMKDKVEMIK